MIRRLLPLVLLVVVHGNGNAGRPLATDDAATVERDGFELEMGYQNVELASGDKVSSGEVTFNHGITERMDFMLIAGYADGEKEVGIAGSEIVIKYSLLRERERGPDVSLTFANPLGTSEYEIRAIFSRERRCFISHLNLGFAHSGVTGEEGLFIYGFALEFPLRERLTLMGEVVGETDADSDTKNPVEGLVGGTVELAKGAVLDLGVSFGFTETAPEFGFIVGLTKGFK